MENISSQIKIDGRQQINGTWTAHTVNRFIQPTDTIIAEFTEIESGKNDKRPELWKAISLVKKTKAKLLIPKLDRFSRKVSFISGIIDQGIVLSAAD